MTEYIRGQWYDLQEQAQRAPGTGIGLGVTVANELITWTVIVQEDVYLTGVRWLSGVQAATSGRFLMWQPSAVTGHAAGSPVVDSGLQAVPATGPSTTRTITFASRILVPAGIYRAGFIANASGLGYSSISGYDSNVVPFHDEGLGLIGGTPGAMSTTVNARHTARSSASAVTLIGSETWSEADQTGGSGSPYNPATPNGFIQPWVEWQVAPIPPATFIPTSDKCVSPATFDGTVSGDSFLTVGDFTGFSVPASSATITFTTSGGATVSPGSGALSAGPWLCTVPVGGKVAYHIGVPGSTAAARDIEMCTAPFQPVQLTSVSSSGRQTGATYSLAVGTLVGTTYDIAMVTMLANSGAAPTSALPGWTLLARRSTGLATDEWWGRTHSPASTTVTLTNATNHFTVSSYTISGTTGIGSTISAGSSSGTPAPAIPLSVTAAAIGATYWENVAPGGGGGVASQIVPGSITTIPRSLPVNGAGTLNVTVPNTGSSTTLDAVLFTFKGFEFASNCIIASLAACPQGGWTVGSDTSTGSGGGWN